MPRKQYKIVSRLQRIKNILVIRPGALGDFILTLPVFSYLRRKFPQAHIEIIGYPYITEIAVGRYYANRAFRFDHPEIAHLFLKDAQLPERLSRYLYSFGMIVSFLAGDIFVANLNRASRGYVLLHEPFLKDNETIHIIDYLLSPWEDVLPEERIPRIFLTESDRQWASDFFDRYIVNSTAPLVILHPGSGGHKKCWPVENFVSLALHLRKELDVRLLLVSGPADEEVTNYFLKHVQPQPVLLYNLPLPRLAAVLERGDLFVGNDSGVTHLVAATGATTLALFGPTDPKVWGPRGKRVKIIQGKVSCSPCSIEDRRHCKKSTCMESIPIEQVINIAEEILISLRQTYPLTKEG